MPERAEAPHELQARRVRFTQKLLEHTIHLIETDPQRSDEEIINSLRVIQDQLNRIAVAT